MSTSSKQILSELNQPTPRSGLVAPVIPLADPVDGLLTLEALQAGGGCPPAADPG